MSITATANPLLLPSSNASCTPDKFQNVHIITACFEVCLIILCSFMNLLWSYAVLKTSLLNVMTKIFMINHCGTAVLFVILR